jgi:hypothetical protein
MLPSKEVFVENAFSTFFYFFYKTEISRWSQRATHKNTFFYFFYKTKISRWSQRATHKKTNGVFYFV